METLEILAPMCHLLLSYISRVNELVAVGGF